MSYGNSRHRQGFECPHCGAFVAAGQSRCRQCGASDEYGWGDADQNEPDHCEDDFDYDEYVSREFPQYADTQSPAGRRKMLVGWIIAALVAALLIGMIA